jgi:hypothetical protein
VLRFLRQRRNERLYNSRVPFLGKYADDNFAHLLFLVFESADDSMEGSFTVVANKLLRNFGACVRISGSSEGLYQTGWRVSPVYPETRLRFDRSSVRLLGNS